MSQAQKLSVTEKVGYSLGDLAANLVFQTLVTFIAYYYTDVYKLPADKAEWVIATCGILGGVIFAPLMGMIADRTKTQWGRYRPWIMWTAIPFAVMVFLTFRTPDLPPNAKLVYAFVTYLAMVMLYTANNLPYAALSGVLTGSMAERNSLSSYRFVAVMVAQFIIQVLLRPLVLVIGNGDEALGFEKTMMILAIVGMICFFITFLTTKERVIETQTTQTPILQDIADLLKNRPWVIMLLVTISIFVTLALKGGSYVYYFKYYADQDALKGFLDQIGFNGLIGSIQAAWPNFKWPEEVDASAFGLFNGAGIILMIVGIGFSKPLADKFGKRNVFGIALFFATLFVVGFNWLPRNAIGTMFIFQALHGFIYGITIPLLWAMIADVADYSEWKNNRRATGIVFSAMILGLKGGLTLGSAMVVSSLAKFGYSADALVQTPTAIEGIKTTMSVYASIPFFIAAGLMIFFEINKKMETQIETDLAGRRKAMADAKEAQAPS